MTIRPPLPANEPERLRALHRLKLSDGAMPSGLDRLCSAARDLFQVPVVLMVFLDETIAWIKDRPGANLTQAPRDLSFCNYTIMHDGVFVVPDARADRRFVSHPYVTADPPLRFYAGAPFVTEPGIRIGSICIVDHVPRDFTPQQMSLLEGLARMAVGELWLHHLANTGLTAAEPSPVEAVSGAPDPRLHFQVEPALTGAQVRAARGLVRWSVRELAQASGLAQATIKRLEAHDAALDGRGQSARIVRAALEGAGVQFTFEPNSKPGVRPH